jgi:hypothetical protein
MDKEQEIAGWKRNCAVLGLALGGMNHFSTEILRVAIKAAAISDAEIIAIMEQVTFNMKNTGADGLPLEQETEILRESVQFISLYIETVIKQARQPEQ